MEKLASLVPAAEQYYESGLAVLKSIAEELGIAWEEVEETQP